MPPQSSPQIDWNSVPSSTPAIDWGSVASNPPPLEEGMKIHPGTTVGARGGVEGWLEDLQGDIKHGTESTLPGRLLHKVGFQGIESGAGGGEGGVGDVMGGELLGPTQVAHGLIRGNTHPNANFDAKAHDVNEVM